MSGAGIGTTGGGHQTHATVRQELDRVRPVPLVLLILASVALIAVGVIWPWLYLARAPVPAPVPRLDAAPRAVAPQPRIIGGVPTDELVERAFDMTAERPWTSAPAEGRGEYLPSLDPLAGFDWADRERETVELPIDIATELWLERHAAGRRAAGGGAPDRAGGGAPDRAGGDQEGLR